MKILKVYNFLFLTVHIDLSLQNGSVYAVQSPSHKDSRSVGIFKIFYFYLFLTISNSAVTYKKTQLLTLPNTKIICIIDREVLSLLLKVNIHANPLIFFLTVLKHKMKLI